MRKLLAIVGAAFLSSQAFGAVAYVNYVGVVGQLPQTTTSYTPGATGNQLTCVGADNPTGAIGWTASASTLTALSVSGSTTFTDGVGNSYAVWKTLSLAAGAQTFTWATPSGNYINGLTYCMEWSGGASIINAVYTITASPGAGAGAVLGAPVTVATTDQLVTVVFDGTTGGGGTAATVNGPASSSNVTTYGDTGAWYWTGTGSSMTPTFTAPTGQTTDTWIVIQMDVSATGSGGTPGILLSNGHPVRSNGHPVLSN